jgi:hypothetical protein
MTSGAEHTPMGPDGVSHVGKGFGAAAPRGELNVRA